MSQENRPSVESLGVDSIQLGKHNPEGLRCDLDGVMEPTVSTCTVVAGPAMADTVSFQGKRPCGPGLLVQTLILPMVAMAGWRRKSRKELSTEQSMAFGGNGSVPPILNRT